MAASRLRFKIQLCQRRVLGGLQLDGSIRLLGLHMVLSHALLIWTLHTSHLFPFVGGVASLFGYWGPKATEVWSMSYVSLIFRTVEYRASFNKVINILFTH